MASIFTYDPDPPRVSSPWTISRASTPRDTPPGPLEVGVNHDQWTKELDGDDTYVAGDPSTLPLTKLEAEPQEGPTEYKLHLLLRPRRSFTSTTTGRYIPGSYRQRVEVSATATPARRISDALLASTPPPGAAAALLPSRQHRLEQLTTQLLWRLQQSSPYHASASNKLILPQLPEASTPQLNAPCMPAKLLPGLEESKGALYEIGVSDDGTFIGLAADEMEESLNNLRAMAASLGCRVEVLRRVPVGDCEWIDTLQVDDQLHETRTKGRLWVAEAFVKPDLDLLKSNGQSHQQQQEETRQQALDSPAGALATLVPATQASTQPHPLHEQLRVSLTGAAHSGKSSLLGSLTTATLDNGRGKSRLSLLKHRHEIESGRTSSVAQELIGYRVMESNGHTEQEAIQVVNYASDNVSVWTDIHGLAEFGRLVFFSDSPGEPRFRRTTVRGLVGWAPHWTLLCVPADNGEDALGKASSTPSLRESLDAGATNVDLSQTHLQLCLDLDLPLVIVITKLDVASKSGLRQTLSKVLSSLKTGGRKPSIISDAGTVFTELGLQSIQSNDLDDVRRVAGVLGDEPNIVPIILTSAVKGTGISKLHALLYQLPVPSSNQSGDFGYDMSTAPSPLFHIEDVYSSLLHSGPSSPTSNGPGLIVGGYLRYGTLFIGDELVLGPYPTDIVEGGLGHGDGTSPSSQTRNKSLPPLTSRSFPGALHKSSSTTPPTPRSGHHTEWRRVRIVSLRNLRLPVITLHAGQVGTIGIEPVHSQRQFTAPALVRTRKGMVIAASQWATPKARRVFTARFADKQANGVRGLSIGTPVVVYVASVRASAKIVAAATDESDIDRPISKLVTQSLANDSAPGFGFSFDGEEEAVSDSQLWGKPNTNILVSFKFLGSCEFVEAGAKVFVMPGGGITGLEGSVGSVIEDIVMGDKQETESNDDE